MRRIKQPHIFLLFIIFFLFQTQAVLAEQSISQIVKKIMPSVVMVMTYDNNEKPLLQGSGFFISNNGDVITNYHVMQGAISSSVETTDGKVYKVEEIVSENIISDLIQIKVDIGNAEIKPLSLSFLTPTVGEKVIVIGSPEGLEHTVSDGIVSAVRDVPSFGNIIQITAPTSRGSSGSPVINMKGEVIGVASAQMKKGQNLNFVIPASKIKEIDARGQTVTGWTTTGRMDIKRYMCLKEALSYLSMGEAEKALYSLEQLNILETGASFELGLLGMCYRELGRYREALEAYKQAVRIMPENSDNHYDLGTTYRALGFYEEALEAQKQAIKLMPDNGLYHKEIGRAYSTLKRFEEALGAFKQAVRLMPTDAESHSFVGYSYFQLGRLKEALEANKEAVRLEPENAIYNYGVGSMYLGLLRTKEALGAFKQAVKINPKYADAHFSLGISFLIIKDKGSALEEYKILKELDKEKANNLFNEIYK